MRFVCPNGHAWDANVASSKSICGECGALVSATEESRSSPDTRWDGGERDESCEGLSPIGEVSSGWIGGDELPPLPRNTSQPAKLRPAPANVEEQPDRIDEYVILCELGRGGMGVVYKAHQTGLGRIVALKLISEMPYSAAARARFQLEAESLAQLQHPNIVQVYGIGDYQGRMYISLEFVDGGSLADRLDGSPVASREAAELVSVVAHAIEQAHCKGVIHRDLKPDNILLTSDGVPKIADFGLAKRADQDSGQTRTGAVMGTPSFMSPEQAAGRNSSIDVRTDVYSLGAVLYQLLTGRPPHRGENAVATLKQVVEVEPVSVRLLNPSASRDLETICVKCLSKDPARRYASAQLLADDIDRWREGKPIHARRVTQLAKAWRWCRRNPTTAAMASVLAVVLITTAVSTFAYQSQLSALRQVERARQYFESIDAAREKFRQQSPGWRQEALSSLRKASQSDTSVRDPVQLRSVAATCWSALDLAPQRQVELKGDASEFVFRPDSKQLVIAPHHDWLNPSLTLLDAATGDVVAKRKLPRSRGIRRAVGDLLFSGKMQLIGDGAHAITFSPSGRLLAVGTQSGYIHLWNESKESKAGTHVAWKAHEGEITCLEFSDDEQRVYSAALDSTISIWLLPGARSEGAEQEASVRLDTAAYTLSYGYLGSAGQPVIAVAWDRYTKQPLALRNAHDLTALPSPRSYPAASAARFASNRRILALAGGGDLRLIDMESQSTIRSFVDPALGRAHEEQIDYVSFDKTGSILISGGSAGTSKIWDTASGKLLARKPHFARSPALSDDGHVLVVGGRDRNRLALDRLEGYGDVAAIAHQRAPIHSFDISADGRFAACIAGARDLTVWNLADGHREYYAELDEDIMVAGIEVTISPDGRYVACNGSRDVLHVVDRSTHDPPRTIPAQWPLSVDFSPSGEVLWQSTHRELVDFVEMDGVIGRRMPDLTIHTRWRNIEHKAFGPSGVISVVAGLRWVIAGSTDNFAHLISAENGQAMGKMKMDAPIDAVALNHSETLAAVGSRNGLLRVFQLPQAKLLWESMAHKDRVASLDFSRDGSWLASAGNDGVIRVWSTRSNFAELLTRPFHDSRVNQAKFAPDGSRLYFLVGGETAVRVWRVDRLMQVFDELGISP